MTTIHLIRHGQTDWNLTKRIQGQTESSLTELGIQQAMEVGERLQPIRFDAAYTSSSERAHETAKHILQHHGIPLSLADDLREIHLGPWEGQLYEAIKHQDPERYQHFWKNPPAFQLAGAETFEQVQQRALNAIHRMVSQHPDQTLLVVSHGIWIKSLLTAIEGRGLGDFWLPPAMTNCCHSIITLTPNKTGVSQSFSIEQFANLKTW